MAADHLNVRQQASRLDIRKQVQLTESGGWMEQCADRYKKNRVTVNSLKKNRGEMEAAT
jgi:hypothetical protein